MLMAWRERIGYDDGSRTPSDGIRWFWTLTFTTDRRIFMNESNRRQMLTGAAAMAAAATVPSLVRADSFQPPMQLTKLRGNIRHAFARWCYGGISLDDLCQFCVRLGVPGIDLLGPDDFPTLKKYDLTCPMVSAPASIGRGWNRIEHHDELVAIFEKLIPQVAEAGFPNVICMSGNRAGLDDDTGVENCVTGLKRILPLAEKHGVNLVMELLNSKRDHGDYQCDHTTWGVRVCKGTGSSRMKLLYDIYHMQVMEGDVIATLRENIDYIAHIHTGGCPGRNEIDETQELYYPAIMRALLDLKFEGYVAQEFLPRGKDPLASLERCIRICDI